MQKMVKQDQELIKRHNKKMILDIIRRRRSVSRAEITKITKMSATSVSRIVGELCHQGLVQEKDLVSSGIGRKALTLDIIPNVVYTFGVDIDKEIIKLAIINFAGEIIQHRQIHFKSTPSNIEDTVDTICYLMEELIESTGINRNKLIGIGVSVPGVVDYGKGVVLFSAQLGWKKVEFSHFIQEKVNIQTVIDNDLKTQALAECLYGSAQYSTWTALIGLGSGVGSALILNGEIYRGKSNSAGEIGHTTIDPNGILCECGRRGCLQTYIAEWALLQEAKKIKDITSIQELYQSVRKKEAWAFDIINRAAQYIAVTISNIVCMHNPDTVILNGEIIEQYPEIVDLVMEQCNHIIWEPFSHTFQLTTSKLKEQSKLIGAGTLALNKYLKIT